MAEQPPGSPNRRTQSIIERQQVKTPAGVWVVVGLGVFFVLTALGISAYIVFKALGEKPTQRASSTAVVTPVPSAAATPPSVSEASPAMVGVDGGGRSASTADEIMTPPPVVANAGEEDEMRHEVLNRIDLMPGLSQKDKDQLYAQVERARAFSKLAIVPFATGKTSPGVSQIEELTKRLQQPDLKTLVSDPTVVLVMVGYADKQGDQAKNMEISRTRAEGVVKNLKEKLNLMNMMHAVGLGGQDVFDKANLEKNRIVEVWAIQP
jgi:outer membrane protein OmpA-like peptidoglycan-associated protein